MNADDMSKPAPVPGIRERELFIKALEQPTPEAQAAFLAAACGADQTLRGRLDLLLERFENIGTFMGEPVMGKGRSTGTPSAIAGIPGTDAQPVQVATVPDGLPDTALEDRRIPTERPGDTIGSY